jgi:nucleotidyltransferase/DNA polymerase involved in DNA repair
MSHLEELAPRVEQYSIDEMFLDIRGIDSCMNFEDFGRQLRECPERDRVNNRCGDGANQTLLNLRSGHQRMGPVRAYWPDTRT